MVSVTSNYQNSLNTGGQTSRFESIFNKSASSTSQTNAGSAGGTQVRTFNGGVEITSGNGSSTSRAMVQGSGTGTITITTNGETKTFSVGPNGEVTETTETAAPAPAGGASEETGSITNVLRGNPDFEILTAALDATGLTDVIGAQSDLTVLAPTDEAFRILARDSLGFDIEGLSDAEVATLLVDTLGASTISNVLQYHVAQGAQPFEELVAFNDPAGRPVFTPLFGEPFETKGGVIDDADPDEADAAFIGGSTDIGATNGVIHGVDRVLLPLDIPGLGATRQSFPVFFAPVF